MFYMQIFSKISSLQVKKFPDGFFLVLIFQACPGLTGETFLLRELR